WWASSWRRSTIPCGPARSRGRPTSRSRWRSSGCWPSGSAPRGLRWSSPRPAARSYPVRSASNGERPPLATDAPWRYSRAMRFGFFDQLPCAGDGSERQRYHDLLAQIDLGDRVGLDTVWLGELHFSRAFSVLADPLTVLAAAAQRARRIRLGTAVTLLPLHHPVKIAEEAAIADILSDGRLELGCGRGTAPLHYAGYALPQEESRERFEEALDFILKAWTN